MKEVTVLAPATVANVVCGFDCLGFALADPCDEMTLRLTDREGVTIRHHDGFGLTTDPARNIAGVALLAILDSIDERIGFELEITKRIKPGSGVGSSSASAVGAAVAANKLLDERFTTLEIAEFAMKGEQVASEGRHADNVAPCLFGGFTLVRSTDPLDIVSLPHPELFATVIHPQIEIKTADARRLLPPEISLKSAVQGWANVGALVAGLARKDYELIARSLEDAIIEPHRKRLIPGFDEMKSAALSAGALGGGISGSGPSVFMFSRDSEAAHRVELAMRAAFESFGVEFNSYVSEISPKGVRVKNGNVLTA